VIAFKTERTLLANFFAALLTEDIPPFGHSSDLGAPSCWTRPNQSKPPWTHPHGVWPYPNWRRACRQLRAAEHVFDDSTGRRLRVAQLAG